MTIQPPNDGEPLTYDLIKKIVEQVNDLSSRAQVYEKTAITTVGFAENQNDTAIIAADIIAIQLQQGVNAITLADIKFKTTFAKPPVVTLTVYDQRASQNTGDGINSAVATAYEITATGLKVRIQFLREVRAHTSISLHYIAVGAAPSTS